MKVFTKKFFNLPQSDQRQVVDAAIHDLEASIGCHLDAEDDRKAKRQVKRIRKKAVETGIY
jgi:hypothetical protein